MDERLYRWLVRAAITLTVLFVAFQIYDCHLRPGKPGDAEYLAANKLFEDGYYDRALLKYEEALAQDRRHLHALRGKARTLLKLGRLQAAVEAFNAAIAREPAAATYANRGITYDRMGRYEDAIADYEHALGLDPELNEGPHWMTRFLRNQPDKPPGIGDRAAYLKSELAKPPAQRLLRIPEVDDAQRPYKK